MSSEDTMKKKIINQHKEPIVLQLLRPKGRCKHPQRTSVNLIDERIVDESEISPEIEKLARREKIKIEDVMVEVEVVEIKVAAEPPPAPSSKRKKKEEPPPIPEGEKDIEELERELLEDSSPKPLDD
jgi:hypothetical protein